MSIDMSQFYQVFFEETEEHLASMERLLLGLDTAAPDLDDLNAIFRAAHSIKGGSGTFGFSDMAEVTHILENLLDRLRKQELQPTTEMVDAFLQAVDVIKDQLDAHRAGSVADPQPAADIRANLTRLSGDGQTIPPAATPPPSAATTRTSYRIRLANTATAKLDLLLDDLRQAGEVGELRVEKNEASFRLDIPMNEAEIRDLLAFFVQIGDIHLERADAAGHQAAESEAYGFFEPEEEIAARREKAQGYGFFDAPRPSPEAEAGSDDLRGFGFFVDEETLEHQREDAQGYGFFTDPPPAPPSATLPPEASGQRTEVGANLNDPRHKPSDSAPKPSRPPDKPTADASSIRVSVEKVDQLINLVGELVITQAMLAQTASEVDVDPVLQEKLLDGVKLLERNTRDLQESVMSIRMLPISFVFSRFPRMVRDLAAKLKKDVSFVTFGEGTELDKGLIEKITDPLTHLVRNSLDHGIETPEIRTAQGKNPQGTVTLRAFHQGGNVVIEVQDDGAGLHREKILSKARERGLNVGDTLTDADVWLLIFAPGFSTAESVTDVSGRGVGMDVVKRNIESLGGRVEIESFTGAGTKITIRLPLTLAILDGLSIALGNDTFIIPITSIIESLQPKREDIKSVTGQGRVVHVRGEYLPLISLSRLFGIRPRSFRPEESTLMIVDADGEKAAFMVDELLGQHQVVIKSLETNYRKVPGVSGATILGDGRVALILDVTAVVRSGKHQWDEQAETAQEEPVEAPLAPSEAGASIAADLREPRVAAPESAEEELLLERAVDAHTRWKTRLRVMLDGGGEKLDRVQVAKDYACDLGKWIHGPGDKHKNLPTYRSLKESHAKFHRCASEVVKKYQEGDKPGAEKMLAAGGAFLAASSATVSAIRTLEKDLRDSSGHVH